MASVCQRAATSRRLLLRPLRPCAASPRGGRMEAVRASALEETLTLRQAKKLIQCMSHEQSFLLLSPPGVGKSEMVYEAAAEVNLPCRSLLGTQIAPEDVSGIPRIVGERSVFCPPRLLLPENPAPFCLFLDELPACAGCPEGLLFSAAGTATWGTCVAQGHMGCGGGQPNAGSGARAFDELGPDQSRHHPQPARRH